MNDVLAARLQWMLDSQPRRALARGRQLRSIAGSAVESAPLRNEPEALPAATEGPPPDQPPGPAPVQSTATGVSANSACHVAASVVPLEVSPFAD